MKRTIKGIVDDIADICNEVAPALSRIAIEVKDSKRAPDPTVRITIAVLKLTLAKQAFDRLRDVMQDVQEMLEDKAASAKKAIENIIEEENEDVTGNDTKGDVEAS